MALYLNLTRNGRRSMTLDGAARRCPFCALATSAKFGSRMSRIYLRCATCGSIFRDLDQQSFASLHEQVFKDDAFIQRQMLQQIPEPSHRDWRSIPHPTTPGRMLDIGPGTGHLMAAAASEGWQVIGVEHSPVHRDFIQRVWNFEVLRSLDMLDRSQSFNLIVMVNVLEHVYDVQALLMQLKPLLSPGGEIVISAPNANCMVATFAGTWWSMFKPIDHVSIPSAEGLRRLGARTGLTVRKVWSTELPFETALGLLVAWQDWARRDAEATTREDHSTTSPVGRTWRNRVIRVVNRIDARWEPINQLLAWWGRAGSIKVAYKID